MFAESKSKPYTAQDLRFTTKGHNLYVLEMERPDDHVLITSILPDMAVKSVHLLGHDQPLDFSPSAQGLRLTFPKSAANQLAYVYRIEI